MIDSCLKVIILEEMAKAALQITNPVIIIAGGEIIKTAHAPAGKIVVIATAIAVTATITIKKILRAEIAEAIEINKIDRPVEIIATAIAMEEIETKAQNFTVLKPLK